MSATKVDYRRELGPFYKAGRNPELVDVPELSFLMVDGRGDPNTAVAYREAIEALYSITYRLKFTLKRAPAGLDYAVMPLEGLWWSQADESFASGRKSDWRWTAMILQPDEVTGEMVNDAIQIAERKRPLPAARKLRLERFREGRAAQVMHVGPYSAEAPTIAKLHEFIADQGLSLTGKHHEIYLGDPRRAAPEKLRTIVRQPVAG
jgi:hypothetical protein